MIGSIWIIFLLTTWFVFLITGIVLQSVQYTYVIAFPIIYIVWILTLIIPYLRRANVCQLFILFLNIFMLTWVLLYYYSINPVLTTECGSTLCSNSVESGQYFNALSSRISVGNPLQHRMICPKLSCRWASDNGKALLGYHLDSDGLLDFNQPNGAYASSRPEDFQDNLARGFKNGYIEGITLINEQVQCPGVSSEIDPDSNVIGRGEVICSHCSHYLLGTCKSNGLEYICELCPKPVGYIDMFWISWFAIWLALSIISFCIKDSTYPIFCEKHDKNIDYNKIL